MKGAMTALGRVREAEDIGGIIPFSVLMMQAGLPARELKLQEVSL